MSEISFSLKRRMRCNKILLAMLTGHAPFFAAGYWPKAGGIFYGDLSESGSRRFRKSIAANMLVAYYKDKKRGE